MVKKIVLGVGGVLFVLIVMFLIVVAMQPSEYEITRSATMQAPPATVVEQVNNFHNWQAWSPWEKLDPKMERKFEGPDEGKGAKYSWNGNDKVGEGKMEIVGSQPELVEIRLEFMRPMASVCKTEFQFAPEGDATKVTWTMSGTNDFMGKAFCLFMDMDKLVGADFEKGLASMKTIVEKPASESTDSQPAEKSAPAPDPMPSP